MGTSVSAVAGGPLSTGIGFLVRDGFGVGSFVFITDGRKDGDELVDGLDDGLK